MAHREEDVKKVWKVKRYWYPITYLDYPIELYGLYNKAISANIVSFYSTALVSLPYLYSSNFFYIQYNFSNDIVKEVYNYFKLLKIKELILK